MSRRTTKLLKAALSALYYSRAGDLISPLTSGAGVIFMLHQVRPDRPESFQPNRTLQITPTFLESVILQVLEAGFEVLSLDEVKERLENGAGRQRPFAAFTFDDGYRDNAEYALPVFRRYSLPLTAYVPTDFPDGKGDLWWLALEEVIRRTSEVSLTMDGALRTFRAVTTAEKDQAYHAIYWWLRGLPEVRARSVVAELCESIGYDPKPQCRKLAMDWDELRAFAADPLVTIGAHTISHLALSKLSLADARHEVAQSVRRIETELSRPCRHFSYPYGCASSAGHREFDLARELGLHTAVTTRKGLIHTHHRSELTALPRFSLNGDFQDQRYVKVMLSGAPFAFWNALQRLSHRQAYP